MSLNALRSRCEDMLEPGEEVILEADAQGVLGSLRLLVPGHGYLTTQRIIWLNRRLLLFPRWLYRSPDSFAIRIADMQSVVLSKQLSYACLLITMGKRQQLQLRLGSERFFSLRNNVSTTSQWFQAIQQIRAKGVLPDRQSGNRQ